MNVRILKNRDFTLTVAGQLVSLIGTVLQNFALSLYVLKITGSGKLFASVLAISIIPRLILGPICGVFADWFDRKKIIVSLDFLSSIIIAILYVISITIGIQMYHIYITVILLSVISSLFNPALTSIIPSIVKKEDLVDANSMNVFVITLGNLASPVLAGVLYGLFGLPVVLLINSASFLFSAVSELFIRVPKLERDKTPYSYKKFKDDFIEGIDFIKSKSVILNITISAFIINFALNPTFQVGFVYVSKIVLKITDIQLGIMQTCFLLGSVAAPLIAGYFTKKIEFRRIFVIGLLICSILVSIAGLNIIPFFMNMYNNNMITYFILTILSFVISFDLTIVNISLSTIIQNEVPLQLMGRFSSVFSSIAMGATPLGQMLFGILFDLIPSHYLFFFAALVIMLTASANRFSMNKITKKAVELQES